LPVRWYSEGYKYDTLSFDITKTAFMIVDSDGGEGNPVIENFITPALAAARRVGMKVIFIHNDFTMIDDPGNIKREIHGTRWGSADAKDRPPPALRNVTAHPRYSPSIAPLDHEPDFPKREWSGFHETFVDYHLRMYGIQTLIAVGFSQRACLYQTCVGAVEHNYRVVMLRDCTYSAEYPDTVDPNNPEGGWLRFVMLRNFEHIIGYTSTSAEFVEACKAIERT
jgi:nicotinamidase-related amidase